MYEKQFSDGLRRYFEDNEGNPMKRVVRRGDVIAIPVRDAIFIRDEDLESDIDSFLSEDRYVAVTS